MCIRDRACAFALVYGKYHALTDNGQKYGGQVAGLKRYLLDFSDFSDRGVLLSLIHISDILQEALPNVVAAHVMQSYIGGYGNMIQPVSACATAAVSLEEGVDKIALGKADFVVTGAIDDIGVESVIGFGNMNATANSEEMYGKGIDARFFSRANDRRRGGFLESQGGGTILVTRGDIAEKPVSYTHLCRHHHHRRADRRHPRPLRNRRHQARAGRTAGRRCR